MMPTLKWFETLHHWDTGLNRRIGRLIFSVHFVTCFGFALGASCLFLLADILHILQTKLHSASPVKTSFLSLFSLRCGWNLERSSPSSTGTTCWNQASGESLRTQCSTKEWWSTPWRMCPWWVSPTRTLCGPWTRTLAHFLCLFLTHWTGAFYCCCTCTSYFCTK